jgi:adenine-specific DNA-methyltransferase
MQLDPIRLDVSAQLDRKQRSTLGQFMTPSRVAAFMASLFPKLDPDSVPIHLLDAGAGIGSLSAAFLDRWLPDGASPLSVTAFEIDPVLRARLANTLASYQESCPLGARIVATDFIEAAVNWLQFQDGPRFTHAILNPPYKKISSQSRHRHLLRAVGIETVNLYSAFIALAVALMAPGGQIVAIIPRSFCNGPYYKPFRAFLLNHCALRHLHLFEARDKAFRDDEVLQENLILLLEKGGDQGDVRVSTSADDRLEDYAAHDIPFSRIVYPDDAERFIHIPTSAESGAGDLPGFCQCSLDELGLQVSTGPVVDFRLKAYLRDMPEDGCIPLLYPGHFSGAEVVWPKPDGRKPNALMLNEDTQKWLMPAGCYAVVRRFSSKEEKRRIVAALVDAQRLGSEFIAFENHLNVFHQGKQGLPENLARGLCAYLNTTVVDQHFRRFSGHTQVNATDLRRMRYPSKEVLEQLGQWAKSQGQLDQQVLDEHFFALA